MNPQEENKPENKIPTAIPVPPIKNQEEPKRTSGNDFFIRPLRTYEDDVKNAVKTDSISTAKILMAEQQKRQVEKENFEESSPKSQTNIVKIAASVILVLLSIGIVGGGTYYYFQKKASEIPQQVTILTSNNFIDTEEVIKVNKINRTNREVVGEIRKIISSSANSMSEDTIKEIKLIKTVVTTENGKEFSNDIELTTEEFMKILEAREPDALTRALDPKFLLGVHKTKTSVEPFIIFRINDYEISYAKMLEWEWVLVPDIQDIFYKNLGSSQAFIKYEEDAADNAPLVVEQPTIIATSTDTVASSTSISQETTDERATTTSSKYEYRNFKDLILANRDTRSISSVDGKLLFFYSFIDRKNLILTTNIETMNIIINRLNSAKLVR